MKRKTTIKTVAKDADVSFTTVSHIVSDRGNRSRYSDATVARVLAAAQRLGYTPCRRSHGMRTGQNLCVSVLTPLMNLTNLRYHSLIFSGAACVLGQQGYMTELVTLNTPENTAKILRNTDGVLFSVEVEPDQVAAVQHHGLPAIWVNTSTGAAENSVDPDDQASCGLLAGHLNSMGYRHVLFVAPTASNHVSVRIRQEALRAALNSGVAFQAMPLDESAILGHATAIREGKLQHAVFVAYSDTLRLIVEHFLTQAGLQVPKDVGTASCHGGTFGSTVARMMPSTEIVYSETDLGVIGARMLLDRIVHGGASVPSVLLPGKLVVGRTTCLQSGL